MNQTEKLTPKQKEILILLYRFRFLNRHHIQQYLNHKDHRRINAWLKYLTEKNYIHRIYSKTFGQNIMPAIYFLKTKSVQTLRGEKEVSEKLLIRIYREHLRSDNFIEGCLLQADIYLSLKSLCRQSKAGFHFFTKTDLVGHNYLPQPMPDLYFTISEGKVIKRYFLEIYSKKTPRYALRHRVLRFFNYYASNVWEKTTRHPFPAVLLVCPDQFMQGYLNKFIKESMEEEDNFEINFFTATAGKIRKEGVRAEVWKAVS